MISTDVNYESNVDNANRSRLRIPKHCAQQMVTMVTAILTFCRVGQHAYWRWSRFTVEVSPSHADTPHTVGFLWTSDRPVAATSTWEHTTFATHKQLCPLRLSNSQSQEVPDGRSTP